MSGPLGSLWSLPALTVALLGCAAVLYLVLARATRRAPHPWYANDALIELVLAPVMVGLIGGGGVLAMQLVARLFGGVLPATSDAIAALALATSFGIAIVLLARAVPRGDPLAPVLKFQPARTGSGRPDLPRAA